MGESVKRASEDQPALRTNARLLIEARDRMSESAYCDIFVDDPCDGVFSVQIQLPALTITLTAHDLMFAKRILDFISETRSNPTFRDAHLGNGVYRHVPQKLIDLSSSFCGTTLQFEKDGEYDSRYFVRMHSSSSRVTFSLGDQLLDVFAESLQEVIDNSSD